MCTKSFKLDRPPFCKTEVQSQLERHHSRPDMHFKLVHINSHLERSPKQNCIQSLH